MAIDPKLVDKVVCPFCDRPVRVTNGAFLDMHKREVSIKGWDRDEKPIEGLFVVGPCDGGNLVVKKRELAAQVTP